MNGALHGPNAPRVHLQTVLVLRTFLIFTDMSGGACDFSHHRWILKRTGWRGGTMLGRDGRLQKSLTKGDIFLAFCRWGGIGPRGSHPLDNFALFCSSIPVALGWLSIRGIKKFSLATGLKADRSRELSITFESDLVHCRSSSCSAGVADSSTASRARMTCFTEILAPSAYFLVYNLTFMLNATDTTGYCVGVVLQHCSLTPRGRETSETM